MSHRYVRLYVTDSLIAQDKHTEARPVGILNELYLV